jgi:hypothetical protein
VDAQPREVLELPIHGGHELVKSDGVVVPPSSVARLRGAHVAGVNSGVVVGRRFVVPVPDQVLELGPLLFAEFLEGARARYATTRPCARPPPPRRGPGHQPVTHNYFHFVMDALQAGAAPPDR